MKPGNDKSCPVCGTELKPLFSSLQCFNDNCLGDAEKFKASKPKASASYSAIIRDIYKNRSVP